MSLITFFIVILVFVLLMYIINKYVEDIVARRILNIAIALILVLWTLKILGVFGYLGSVRL